MDVKTYEQAAKAANKADAELTAARDIVHAVYTGKKRDAELGKALDAMRAAAYALEDVAALLHKDAINGEG